MMCRMSEHIHKAHNVSALLYHLVCPTKYRRAVITDAITDEVDAVLQQVCFDISNRYEVTFLEIGADQYHVHFLVQSVPSYSPTKIVTLIKSITAREVFRRVPSVRAQLWGGAFWSSGYDLTTVGRSTRWVDQHGGSPRQRGDHPRVHLRAGETERVP
jgi:putative transposase